MINIIVNVFTLSCHSLQDVELWTQWNEELRSIGFSWLNHRVIIALLFICLTVQWKIMVNYKIDLIDFSHKLCLFLLNYLVHINRIRKYWLWMHLWCFIINFYHVLFFKYWKLIEVRFDWVEDFDASFCYFC